MTPVSSCPWLCERVMSAGNSSLTLAGFASQPKQIRPLNDVGTHCFRGVQLASFEMPGAPRVSFSCREINLRPTPAQTPTALENLLDSVNGAIWTDLSNTDREQPV